MDYKLSFSPRAEIELNQAVDYYSSKSETAMVNFLAELEFAYKTLKTNPYFQIRYENVRSLPLISFPYILFFTIQITTHIIFIRSVFNTYQNPTKYPKYIHNITHKRLLIKEKKELGNRKTPALHWGFLLILIKK